MIIRKIGGNVAQMRKTQGKMTKKCFEPNRREKKHHKFSLFKNQSLEYKLFGEIWVC